MGSSSSRKSSVKAIQIIESMLQDSLDTQDSYPGSSKLMLINDEDDSNSSSNSEKYHHPTPYDLRRKPNSTINTSSLSSSSSSSSFTALLPRNLSHANNHASAEVLNIEANVTCSIPAKSCMENASKINTSTTNGFCPRKSSQTTTNLSLQHNITLNQRMSIIIMSLINDDDDLLTK